MRCCLIITGDGKWCCFERTPDEPEGIELDHGILSYSEDEDCTYYAYSTMNEGVRYRVFEFEDDYILWDDVSFVLSWENSIPKSEFLTDW
ncbi:MAG: hypothetical protein ACI4K7_11970 [Oscillospiraceae bacterium]